MDFAGVRIAPSSLVVEGIAQGAVTAGKTVSVSIGGVTVTCAAERGLTTAAGDRVYGIRSMGKIIIIGRLWAAAPGSTDEGTGVPPPEPTVRYGETIIAPVETRSYRPNWGWRTDNDDVYQGEYGNNGNHIGSAFYGRKPRSLAGVEVTKAWIKVKRVKAGDYAARGTTLKRLVQSTRPSGEPDFVSGAEDGPSLAVGESENFIILDSWAQDLIDGNAGGLAINAGSGDPYVRLAGRHSWSPSFVLTIQWKRIT